MNAEIKQLTELQDIDLQIATLDAEINSEQAELEKRKTSYNERQLAIQELQAKVESAEAKRKELDTELTDELSRIKERQSKMMQVQTNREYQSLLKEIEDGKKANKEREDEIVQLMEQIESLTKIMTEEGNLCESEEKELEDEATKLETLASKVNRKIDVIAKSRDKKANDVKTGLLKKYDALRIRRNGKAVVGVTDATCQGCFMNIPPQQFNDILRGDKLITCPTCQRILYYLPETDKE